jgi:hypothetical protein
MDRVVQQFFERLLDPPCHANVARGGSLKQRLEKLGFLFFALIASVPLARIGAFYRFRPEPVVPGDHVMHGRNRNVGVNSDLQSRPRVSQHASDNQTSTMVSSGRSPE